MESEGDAANCISEQLVAKVMEATKDRHMEVFCSLFSRLVFIKMEAGKLAGPPKFPPDAFLWIAHHCKRLHTSVALGCLPAEQ